MSVIIRLQNLPWSANALDIRNFFRGLSIPEGGVHIVGGELGDAFIAFSTDEDARQAMMLDGGKIKEIQVKLHLSSRSEMHKVIEAARQNVPILTLTAPAAIPAPVVTTAAPLQTMITQTPSIPQVMTPFAAALSANNTLSGFGIPGLGNPNEIPQPAVIEPPTPITTTQETNAAEQDGEKYESKRSKDKRRSRSRSRSRSKDRKDRKRDRRDRSRSRERRRRDRSRSRDRRDRKRDRKDRSRSRDRSPSRRSRDRRNIDHKSPNSNDVQLVEQGLSSDGSGFTNLMNNIQIPQVLQRNTAVTNPPTAQPDPSSRFQDPAIAEAYNKLQELGKKRNPNAFQGDQQNGMGRFSGGRGGISGNRGGRPSRFEPEQQKDCCVAIRNAPNHTSYGDVRRFFPYLIDKHGIKMINDNLGRRTGNIFVRFCDSRSKQLALQRRNNELKGERVVVESLDDNAYESAVDSFLPYREENDEEDHNLTIADTQEPENFTVLKLSDLPYFVKEHDIIKIFSNFSLLSIVLNDCRETRTKTAFVQFVKPEDAKMAYERKGQYSFGKRNPVITPISNEDYDKEKLQNDKLQEPAVVEPPIKEFPQENPVPRDPRQRRPNIDTSKSPSTNGPLIRPQTQGQIFPPTFSSQAQFPTPNISFNAPQFTGFPNNASTLDPRTAAANWANRPTFPTPMQSRNVIADDAEDVLDCVLIKGLPADTTDRTIVNFLADTGAVPTRIHLMLDMNGMPSGDCFCEFRSTQEARRAKTKHGQNLKGCRITIDLVPRNVVNEALEGPKQPESVVSEGLLGKRPDDAFPIPMGGFPSRGSFRGRGGGNYDGRGFNRGFDHSRGGFRGRGNWNDRGRGGFERGRGRGFPRGRGGFDNGREQREIYNNAEQDPALEDFGAPGCIVSMENVPFRATVDDILGFFSDFELTQDDIIRRFNERGQPTGDARVAFRTPFDAQRAVKTRHMNTINDRRISLNLI